MKYVYIAHPLGTGADRQANLLLARKWVAWAASFRDVAPIADWILIASEWDESRREAGLAIDLALIERCDEVWLCGPRVSPGMQLEKQKGESLGKPIRDFTGLGHPVVVDGIPSLLEETP